jgi:hypothetical protein
MAHSPVGFGVAALMVARDRQRPQPPRPRRRRAPALPAVTDVATSPSQPARQPVQVTLPPTPAT